MNEWFTGFADFFYLYIDLILESNIDNDDIYHVTMIFSFFVDNLILLSSIKTEFSLSYLNLIF